jgi:hypothetical protein
VWVHNKPDVPLSNDEEPVAGESCTTEQIIRGIHTKPFLFSRWLVLVLQL